ncbi:MAG: flagellar biosynthetic protein FliO [Lachnospiraceae bacterium]|jgi:flagellar protein FliO/FliZ|nr:flagellar biosynthetic protein FliO [Lachnospiraceae bacterium]
MILALSDRAESFTQFLTVILVFLLVLALTYFTTRFVGNYQKARSVNRNFEVIETYRITNGKYLQIVKIGEKYMVIGIGKDNITSICELSADDIKPVTESPSQSIETFKNILDKARQRIGKGGNGNEK